MNLLLCCLCGPALLMAPLSKTCMAQSLIRPIDLPRKRSQLVGTYTRNDGFTGESFDLHADGTVDMLSWSDDRQDMTLAGTWTFSNDRVVLRISYMRDSKRGTAVFKLIPAIWGAREMLVDEEELLSGKLATRWKEHCALLPRLGFKDMIERRLTDDYVRGEPLRGAWPLRFGKPVVPDKYRRYVEGIDLNWKQ